MTLDAVEQQAKTFAMAVIFRPDSWEGAVKSLLLLTFALGLVLPACGTQQPPVPALPSPAAPTFPPPTATAMPATDTPQPSPTATPIPCQPAGAASAGNEWDYVVMGDSVVNGLLREPPAGYAGYLEKDLGVKVTIHNWEHDQWSSQGMLNALRTDAKLRQDLCEAEVVVFEVPRYVFNSPGQVYASGNPAACGGTDNQDCLRKALNIYKEHVDAIIAEIVLLRSPSDALIRTFDAQTFWEVKATQENGTFEGMNRYWQAANDYLVQAAARYQIPVARVNRAFNGPNGDEDPFDKGLLFDPIHPSVKGMDLVADLMRGLGYERAP